MRLLFGAIVLVCIPACGTSSPPQTVQQMGFRAALQELIVNSGNEDVCKYYWANEIIIRLDPVEEVERAIAENDLRLIAIRTIGPLDVPGVGEVTESNIPQAGVWIVPGLDDVVVSKVYERLITEFAYSYNTTLKERLSKNGGTVDSMSLKQGERRVTSQGSFAE